MNNLDQEQQLVRRYLLHNLPDDEREQFEERVITDPEFQEITSLIEDELVDDYVGDRLSADEREKFRRHCLSTPQQLERLQLALLLSEKAEIPEPVSVPAEAAIPSRLSLIFQSPLRYVLMGAVGVLIVTVVWFGVRPGTDDRAALEKKIFDLNHDKNVTPDLTVKLSPQIRSAQESQNVTLTPGVEVVQLELKPWPANYKNCKFRLKITGGSEIFAVPCLLSETENTLTLKIPARTLAHQDYQLSVLGTRDSGPLEEIENYSFRVTLK